MSGCEDRTRSSTLGPRVRVPIASLLITLGACSRPSAVGTAPSAAPAPSLSPSLSVPQIEGSSAPVDSAPSPAPSASAPPVRSEIGPWEILFTKNRTVFFSLPRSAAAPGRLIANLHGVCNPPGYACGYWVEAASEKGLLVCPTGNARCGPEAFNAPTWTISYDKMGEDLELAIGAVIDRHPGTATREGAVLTGFSMGAYAAVRIAERNPGRWPFLILNEADVSLSAERLRKAGVRAVALIAGERGSQLPGERRTVKALQAKGFPAKLWVMKGAGHHYSSDIDQLMREALDFVLAAEQPPAGATP